MKNKKILIISTQDPKTLKDLGVLDDTVWFKDILKEFGGLKLESVHAPSQKLPRVDNFDAVIIGGSSFSTYDDGQNWIKKAEKFILEASQKKKSILGVCFGHQLVVQAFGGEIRESEKGLEFGTSRVELTDEGRKDPLFKNLPKKFEVQEAHKDEVYKLPNLKNIKILAKNSMSEYQALAIGHNIRTIQFHPEFTPEILKRFTQARKENLKKAGIVKTEEDFEKLISSFEELNVSQRVLINFIKKFV